ncbi:MAG: hypothetical protein QGI31_06785 [Dehalococcoidia bacterium]|jgi:hypothetical protein|nr:hypothetical protein [Dehalococcoidia bacterium]
MTFIFIISACDRDSEHDHDHEEVHADVDGFLLQTSDNQEIYREFKGSTSGNILIKGGQSLELSVSFLDDDRNKILDPSDFQDKSIQISEYEETIISFELKQNIYPFTMLISGLGAGQTFAKLQLAHEGHPDYTSTNKIPVTVE